MPQSLAARHPLRSWLLVFALVVAIAVLLIQLGGSARGLMTLPLHDFVEYWAAGRLNVHGDNPYDPERVHQLEREAGRTSEGILMWNPPWTLPLVMPLGLLDCRLAHLLWLCLQFATVAWCADALWRLYGGPVAQRWIAWLLAFTFLPTIFSLTAGQISPLVLLGAVLFLVCLRQGRDALAGAAAVLLAIKPHLSYIFWIALLLWAIRSRRWSILGGGLLTGLAALGVALLCNPSVLSQYWHTFTSRPPAQYRSPTLGTVLRLLLGEEQFRLQFLAMIPGLVWFVSYWLRQRANWDWNVTLPLLLLMSMLTAPYGAWPFDLVLLLVPVVQVAATISRANTCRLGLLAAAAYLAINGAATAQLAHEVEYFGFIWMTPALLLAYLGLRRPLTSACLSIRSDCP
ncbi:MAG TPA: glycosyltransferase family 87 protein [Gemmataceae bacterium]|nr:glycosyltransferase family 87 protein [Gemmataceae bacterium]